MRGRIRMMLGVVILFSISITLLSIKTERKMAVVSKEKATVISSVFILPNKIKVGEMQTTTVTVESGCGVENVVARIPFEGGIDEVSLSLVGGDRNKGTWSARWKAHNTLTKEYITTIIVTDRNKKTTEIDSTWWDDTVTYWYDQKWSNRKKITVTENSGSTLTAYQVKLTIPYKSQMKADFSDIRFTNADGKTLLDYWLESKTDSSTADFWVEVDSLSASAATNLYCYYGNPGAGSTSSAAGTFVNEISNLIGGWHMDENSGTTTADDSGDAYDLTLTSATWTTSGKFGNALVYNGTSSMATTPSFALTSANNTLSYGGWYYTAKNAISNQSFLGDNAQSTSVGYLLWYRVVNTDCAIWQYADGTNWNTDIQTASSFFTGYDNQWVFAMVVADYANKTVKFYRNGSLVTTDTTANPMLYPGTNRTKRVGGSLYYGGRMDDIQWYNKALSDTEISDIYNNRSYFTPNDPNKALVRKYATTEPTYSIDSNDENSPHESAVGISGGTGMIY